jgi:two-component system phosphate regulon response regulator PhoB
MVRILVDPANDTRPIGSVDRFVTDSRYTGVMSYLILIIEDEPDIARTVAYNFEKEGFGTRVAPSGVEGLRAARRTPVPDLILLDLMLPDMSGHDICTQLRAHRQTRTIPIIMLTARGEEEDRIKGFEVGADDYVTKPFSPRELLARVKAVLRRTEGAAEANDTILKAGIVRVNVDAHRAWVGEEEIAFTAVEYRLLCSLMERKGRVQSREQLIDLVWGMGTAITHRAVDVHIKRLRSKLGPTAAEYVDTVWGVGYRFVVSEADPRPPQ